MSDRLLVSSGAFVAYKDQYYCDADADRLLMRILRTGFEINKRDAEVDWNEAGPRFLNIGAKIMYWYQQACRHRVGQPTRDYFLEKLEKQAIFHEKKKAEKDAEAAAIWTAWWKEQDRLAAYQLKLFCKHQQKKQAQAQAKKRAAEANEREYAREVRARIAARDAKRHTEVAAPARLARNERGEAILMPRM